MKWIETKNVNLINLENVCRILSDEKKVFFCFSSGEYCYEEFYTEKDAEARLEELKKKLL